MFRFKDGSKILLTTYEQHILYYNIRHPIISYLNIARHEPPQHYYTVELQSLKYCF